MYLTPEIKRCWASCISSQMQAHGCARVQPKRNNKQLFGQKGSGLHWVLDRPRNLTQNHVGGVPHQGSRFDHVVAPQDFMDLVVSPTCTGMAVPQNTEDQTTLIA